MTEFDNTLAEQLLKVKITELEMLRDRGYDISKDEGIFTFRTSDFYNYYSQLAKTQNINIKQALSKSYFKTESDGTVKMVYVYYPESVIEKGKIKELNVKAIRSIVKLMQSHDIEHIILMTEAGIRRDALKEFDKLPSYQVESFVFDEMTYNLTKHFLVPKYTLMTNEEMTDMLKRNRLRITDLPRMYKNDPVARYYGAKPGQLFKILRDPMYSASLIPEQLYYRLILAGNRPNDPPKLY